MCKTLLSSVLVFALFFFSGELFAQQVEVELGPDQIGLNETFTIKINVANEKIKSYDQFPDIEGFQKQGISQSSSMNVINGQVTSSNSIIQYYKPSRKGEFTLPAFSIEINGQNFDFEGKTITVTDPVTSGRSRGNVGDPFSDFFNRNQEEPEYIELDDEAFFSVTVDKDSVYAGEGFNMTLAFYMSETNQAPFNFHKPGEQLDEVLKQIKPTNAWEENYNISNIDPEQVMINGKRWVRYKVYEATFYPFSEGTIEIPSIPWEMIKYRVSKNPSLFFSNRQEDFKTFYSAPKTVTVMPLPSHPLRNEVAVGEYQLRENITELEVETGEGFNYSFGISGVGNINAISPPKLLPGRNIDTFDPNVRQQINRGYGRVSGIKEFNYFMTINEASEVNLGETLEWIYFDPNRAVYDTLRPTAIIKAVGESKVNQAISNRRLGGIYDRIASEDNRFLNEQYKYYFTAAINLLLLASVVFLAVVIIRRK